MTEPIWLAPVPPKEALEYRKWQHFLRVRAMLTRMGVEIEPPARIDFESLKGS